MRVLVTGAGGFLGRHVVRALVDRGHEVAALVRPSRTVPAGRFKSGVAIARGDLRVRKGLEDTLTGIEAVVHLAANVTGDEDSQFADTVVGTENLLEAMAEAGVTSLIHCSTFSVYDWRAAGRRLDEGSPLEADLYERDGYAITKTWQERIVRRAATKHGWRLVVLRPGFIWGAGNEFTAGVGHALGPLRLVFGPGRPMPITYVENCAERFAAAVDQAAGAGETINLVDPERVSAWRLEGDGLRSTGSRGWRIPVPYSLGLLAAHAATSVSRWLYRGRGKLPGILMPNRFRARFRPLRFPDDRLRRVFPDPPRHPYEQAWRRVAAVRKEDRPQENTGAVHPLSEGVGAAEVAGEVAASG